MSWYDAIPAENIALTDVGADACANKGTGLPATGTVSYSPIGWKVGKGGFDPVDPTSPAAIVTADTDLTDPVYPAGIGLTPADVAAFHEPPLTVVKDVTVKMKFPEIEENFAIGEWGIYCRVDVTDYGTAPLDVVGNIFLFAIIHHSIQVKTIESVFNRTVTLTNFLP